MSLTLLQGDCLEVMRDLSDGMIDCFVCDLPYGCLTGGGGKEKAKRMEKTAEHIMGGCPWDVKIDLDAFWTQVKRLARNDHTPVLMFCTTKFGHELIQSNPSWFRYDLVWAKTNAVSFLQANKAPMRAHEMIYVFSRKGAYYKRINIIGDFPAGGGIPNLHTTVAGQRCPTSVVTISNKKGKGNHPTEKPRDLYRWLLERYCPDGGTVLDPTAGSFNSCFVAQELGLHAIGIEKDPVFFKKADDLIQYV